MRVFLDANIMVSDLADCGAVDLDEGDIPILGAAIAAHCTHLLTGDFRHFGGLMGKTIRGVRIVSARILSEELVERGWLQPSH